MKGKLLIKSSFVLVLLILFCGVAWSQQSESGGPLPLKKAPKGSGIVLPDGDQPVFNPQGSPLSPMVDAEPAPKGGSIPMWRQLENLGQADKENALIGFEVGDLSQDMLRKISDIENLWNSGDFEPAIGLLRDLEQSGFEAALGISWRVPKASLGPDWGTDVQVGAQSDLKKTSLDFDEQTGNLFCLVHIVSATSNDNWAMNFSSDGGATWSETFAWFGSGECTDVDMGVVDAYCFVAYAYDQNTEGRMRRFHVADGSEDTIYGWVTVFDKGIAVVEVALTHNADSFDNRVYYYAVLADNSLLYLWDDTAAVSWSEVSTGVTDAAKSLDACWNEASTTNFHGCCYVDTAGDLNTALRSTVFTVANHGPAYDEAAIGAYSDHWFVAYEFYTGTDYAIKYWISYDDGATWLWGYVASGGNFWSPDVTARKNGGISVTYQEEVGEPDPCYYVNRAYATPGWSTPVQYNEMDVITGSDMTIEWAPTGEYGCIWLSDDVGNNNAFFDNSGWGTPPVYTLAVSPDPIIGGQTVTFTVTNGDPVTMTYLVYSVTGTGSVFIPQLNVTLGIVNPQLGFNKNSDGTGTTIWSVITPTGYTGPAWLQACQMGLATNVVATSVQ